jgi:hypothetical protein
LVELAQIGFRQFLRAIIFTAIPKRSLAPFAKALRNGVGSLPTENFGDNRRTRADLVT